MPTTIQGCLAQARYCKWYARETRDGAVRRHLLRKAREWAKLAMRKESEIRAYARIVA
jgi:hypothetical protein